MLKKIFKMTVTYFWASTLFALDVIDYSKHTDIKLFPNSYGITSLLLYSEEYLPQMAHPFHTIETVNVDVHTQHILSFSDLFSDEKKALQLITDYARNYYTKKLRQEDNLPTENFNMRLEMIQCGTAAKLENYRYWNVTSKYLKIVFERGQVEPSYFGEETLDIPLSQFKDILNKKIFSKECRVC